MHSPTLGLLLVVSLCIPLQVSVILPDVGGRQHASGEIAALQAGRAGHGLPRALVSQHLQ